MKLPHPIYAKEVRAMKLLYYNLNLISMLSAPNEYFEAYFHATPRPMRSLLSDIVLAMFAFESSPSIRWMYRRFLIQFVALIYLSYIKRQMDEHGLFKNFTMQTVLNGLDIIELYQQPGHENHIAELTKKQVALYMAMDIGLPT